MGFKHFGKKTIYIHEGGFAAATNIGNLRSAHTWGSDIDQFRMDIGATWNSEKLTTGALLSTDVTLTGPNSAVQTDSNDDGVNSEFDAAIDTTAVHNNAEWSMGEWRDDRYNARLILDFPEDSIYPYHSLRFSPSYGKEDCEVNNWSCSQMSEEQKNRGARFQIITVHSKEHPFNTAPTNVENPDLVGPLIYPNWLNGQSSFTESLYPELTRLRLRTRHTGYTHFLWTLTGVPVVGAYEAASLGTLTADYAGISAVSDEEAALGLYQGQTALGQGAGGAWVQDNGNLPYVLHMWMTAANPNKQGISPPGGWSTIIPGTFRMGKIFYDYYFELPTPFDLREREEVPGIKNVPLPLSFDLDCRYNFYSQQYENFTSLSGLAEPFLPNIYSILTSNYANTTYKGVGMLATMAGSIGTEFINSQGEKTENITEHNYFDKYISVIGSAPASSVVEAATRHTNIGFTTNNTKYLIDYNTKGNMFPMHVDIQLSTQRNANLVEHFSELAYDGAILKKIMQANINRDEMGALEGFQVKAFRKASYYVRDTPGIDDPTSFSIYEVPRTVQCMELIPWIDDYNERGSEVFAPAAEQFMTFMGDVDSLGLEQDEESPGPPHTKSSKNNFFRNLAGLILKMKIKKLGIDKMRSVDEIITGKSAYHEILCYRIAKHEVLDNEINMTPIQNFYFMNSNKLDILKFMDTQVVFGKQYKYVVYAYCMVVGTKYSYAEVTPENTYGTGRDYDYQSDRGNDWGIAAEMAAAYHYKADAMCVYEPHIVLAEIPYYGLEANENTIATVYDDPPIAPEVSLFPVRGSTKKLLINLNNNYGEYEFVPVALDQDDVKKYQLISSYQRLNFSKVEKNLVRFKTDDPAKAFQIYRIGPDAISKTTPRPQSYQDFKGKKLKTVITEGASSAAYLDRLSPNKKYYYMFRSIDVHGNVSYPTDMYEVQLVSEPGGDLAYPVIKVVDFEEPLKPKWTKPMRKFLHIEPDPAQTFLNITTLDDINVESAKTIAPQLGVVQDPLFVHDETNTARRFKIRLTSKQSGKKIDFNVRFVHDHKKVLGE